MRKIKLNGPGLIVAVIAMIVALTGGAFAASGGLTSKEKKQVKSIAQTEAKKYQGTGPAGPQGPVGAKGDKGAAGSNGANGIGVTSIESPGAIDTHCTGTGPTGPGGSKFESASATTYACNGKEGPEGEPGLEGEQGEEGSPWTVDEKLPAGKVETGTWAFAATPEDTAGVRVALPFFIPLAGPLEGHVHYQFDADFFTFCEGSTEFPKPKAGELCVYVNSAETPEEIEFLGIFSSSFEEIGASPQGAILKFAAPTAKTSGGGTYAVRAPLAP